MNILIDSNILIDYSFKKDYAVNFFNEALRERYEIYILEDVYAEVKELASVSNFEIIKEIFKQFEFAGLYRKLKTNKKLNEKTDALTAKCKIFVGHDLDRTDRKLIIIALRHNLYIITKDKELQQIAKSEGAHVLAI